VKVVPETAWIGRETCGPATDSAAQCLVQFGACLSEVYRDITAEPVPEPLARILGRLERLCRSHGHGAVAANESALARLLQDC
jgi:hypothetical protein